MDIFSRYLVSLFFPDNNGLAACKSKTNLKNWVKSFMKYPLLPIAAKLGSAGTNLFLHKVDKESDW